jgi:hypothetical protein
LAADIGGEFRRCDLREPDSLDQAIDGSFLVIHTAGPYQGTDYRVAERCIRGNTHYIDIADGRDFVCGITSLNEAARARGLMVAAGASTVPAVSFSMIQQLYPQFRRIDEIKIALSPGNRNPRGAATVAAILSYVGRPIRVWHGERWQTRTGWKSAERLRFPDPVGNRRVYDCDGPDLELFPQMFSAESVVFRAGLELRVLNWLLSRFSLLRARDLLPNLPRYARSLVVGSKLLLPFGSKSGALGVWLRGTGQSGQPLDLQLALVTDFDGPAIPTAPAVLLARKLVERGPPAIGAFPCLNLVTLNEVAEYLSPHRAWLVRGSGGMWEQVPISAFGPLA